MKKHIIDNGLIESTQLFSELSQLIETSKQEVISVINASLSILFWHIGTRINSNILQNKRADYGKRIVVTLSRQLVQTHGNNFEEKNLRRMMQYSNLRIFSSKYVYASFFNSSKNGIFIDTLLFSIIV